MVEVFKFSFSNSPYTIRKGGIIQHVVAGGGVGTTVPFLVPLTLSSAILCTMFNSVCRMKVALVFVGFSLTSSNTVPVWITII